MPMTWTQSNPRIPAAPTIIITIHFKKVNFVHIFIFVWCAEAINTESTGAPVVYIYDTAVDLQLRIMHHGRCHLSKTRTGTDARHSNLLSIFLYSEVLFDAKISSTNFSAHYMYSCTHSCTKFSSRVTAFYTHAAVLHVYRIAPALLNLFHIASTGYTSRGAPMIPIVRCYVAIVQRMR